MKSRIIYLDLLKAFAIFLVVWGHSILHLMHEPAQDIPAYRFICSFHMPLFMTLVGFFSASSLNRSPLEFTKYKFIQLLLPAIVWIIIFTGLAWIILPEKYQVSSVGGFFKNVTLQLWFLKSAFCCYCVFFFSFFIIKNTGLPHKLLWALILSFLISQVFPLFKVNAMYLCFAAGVVINRYQTPIYRNWVGIFIISAIVFTASYILTDGGNNITPMPQIKAELIHGHLGALYDLGKNQLISTALGLSATMALIALFYGLFNAAKDSIFVSYLSDCGRSTLGIYIVQTLILEQIMAAYLKFNITSDIIVSFIVCPLVSFVVLDISLDIVRLLRKHRITSFWLLGITRPTSKTH